MIERCQPPNEQLQLTVTDKVPKHVGQRVAAELRRHAPRLGLVVVLLLGTTLGACSAAVPYEQTAALLSGSGYEWVPLAHDAHYSRAQAEKDFEICVGGLAEQLARVRREGYATPAPSREIRVVEIVTCMETKGWRLEWNKILDEISVAGR